MCAGGEALAEGVEVGAGDELQAIGCGGGRCLDGMEECFARGTQCLQTTKELGAYSGVIEKGGGVWRSRRLCRWRRIRTRGSLHRDGVGIQRRVLGLVHDALHGRRQQGTQVRALAHAARKVNEHALERRMHREPVVELEHTR